MLAILVNQRVVFKYSDLEIRKAELSEKVKVCNEFLVTGNIYGQTDRNKF